jgi:hypothetical protein
MRNADAHRIRTRTSNFRVLLCLPTAPTLPIEGNGDFGTSPLFRQRSNKLIAYSVYNKWELRR